MIMISLTIYVPQGHLGRFGIYIQCHGPIWTDCEEKSAHEIKSNLVIVFFLIIYLEIIITQKHIGQIYMYRLLAYS